MTVEISEEQKGLEFCKGHEDSNDIQIMDPNAWFRKKRKKLRAKMRKKPRTNKMAKQAKVLCHQAWWPQFSSLDLPVEREN